MTREQELEIIGEIATARTVLTRFWDRYYYGGEKNPELRELSLTGIHAAERAMHLVREARDSVTVTRRAETEGLGS